MVWTSCENCGRLTLNIFSTSKDPLIVKADHCYVAMEENNWVQGCKFEDCEPLFKKVLSRNLLTQL
jgi:hypothetical protein